MSVAAVRSEIASLESYGHLHVVDARILVSKAIVGNRISGAELELLKGFKASVDSGHVTSSAEARAVLDSVVKAGPTPFFPRVAGSVVAGGLKWGVGLALVGGAAGALLGMGSGPSDWRGLAMIAGATMGVGVGAGTGLLVGSFRAARD